MANNNEFVDITKVGPGGLKGLMGLNKTQGDTQKVSPYPTYGRLSRNEIVAGQAALQMETPITEYVGRPDIGESMFDQNITMSSQLDDINNTRAELQPWYAKVTAGVGKAAVLAGTTFVSGTAGLVYGLGALATGGEDGKYALSDFWDNNLTKTLDEINTASEQWMPNYYTNKELENNQNGEWYKNIFTANFLGDSIIKNVGFIVGAAYSGKIWANLAGKALQMNKLRNAFTGLAEANGTAQQEVLTGAKLLSQEETLNNLAKAGRAVAKGNIIQSGVGAVTGALGEGSIEAFQAAKEFRDNEYANIEANAGQFQQDAIMDLLSNRPDLIGTSDGLNYIQSKTQEKMDEAKAKVEELSAGVGNITLGANMPLLVASNAIQFGKFFSGGYNTAIKDINKTVRGATKEIFDETGKLVKLEAKKKSIFDMAKATFQNAATEANEEMSQSAISTGAKLYGGSHLNDYLDSKIDPDANDASTSIAQSLMEGFASAAKDPNTYQEGLIGGLFGIMGMPSFRRVNGKLKVDIHGGAIEDWRELNKTHKTAQSAVEYANNLLASDKFEAIFDNFAQSQYREKQKQEALDNKDQFEYKNAEHKQLIEAVINFNKMGRLDILEDMATSYANANTDEEVELIKKNAMREDGTSIFSKMSNEEILNFVHKQAKDFIDTINNYKKISEDLQLQIGDRFQGDDLENMTWMFSNIDNLENRFTEGWDKLAKDESFRKALKLFRYAEEDGTIKTMDDVLNMSPMEALAMLSGNQELIKETGEKAGTVENRAYHTLNASVYQRAVNRKNKSKNRRGINFMQNKLNRLKETLESNVALGTKYNEYISNIQDFQKIADTRSEFLNIYYDYLYNPEKFQEEKTIKQAENVDKQMTKDSETLSNTLKQAKDINEFNSLVDKEKNNPLLDTVLKNLHKEGHEFAKEYKNISDYSKGINEAIDNLEVDDSIKNAAKQIYNSHKNKSQSLNDLVNIKNLNPEDVNPEDLVNQDTGEMVSDVQKVVETIHTAMNTLNSSDAFKNKIKANYSSTKSNGTTGNTSSSSSTTVDDNGVPHIPGTTTSEDLSGGNDTFTDALENKNKGSNPEFKANVIYKFWRQAFHELDINERKKRNFVDNKGSHGEREKLFNYLRDVGAFKYVNEGNLKEDDEVRFMIDPSFIEGMSEADKKMLGGTIFIVKRLENGTYQKLGVLDETLQGKFEGLNNLRKTLTEEYSKMSENDRNKPAISQQSVKVAKIIPGYVPMDKTERPFNEVNGVLDSATNKVNPDVVFGVMKGNKIVIPHSNIHETLIVTPRSNSNKEGRMYLMTKGADGKYYPTLVKVKKFNTKEFDVNQALNKNTSLYSNIVKVLEKMANINTNDQVSAKEIITSLRNELDNFLYMGNFHLDIVGDTIQLRKEEKTNSTHTISLYHPYETVSSGYDEASDSFGPLNTEQNSANKEAARKENSQIVNELLTVLQQESPYIQIKVDDLNSGSTNQYLINDTNVERTSDTDPYAKGVSLLSTNVTQLSMRGGGFLMNYLDENGNERDAVLEAPVETSIATSVESDSSVITGTQVTYNNSSYYVQANGDILNDKGDAVQNLSEERAIIIKDLASFKANYNNEAYKKSFMTPDGKFFITPNGDRGYEIATQKPLGKNKIQEIKDIISGNKPVTTASTNTQTLEQKDEELKALEQQVQPKPVQTQPKKTTADFPAIFNEYKGEVQNDLNPNKEENMATPLDKNKGVEVGYLQNGDKIIKTNVGKLMLLHNIPIHYARIVSSEAGGGDLFVGILPNGLKFGQADTVEELKQFLTTNATEAMVKTKMTEATKLNTPVLQEQTIPEITTTEVTSEHNNEADEAFDELMEGIAGPPTIKKSLNNAGKVNNTQKTNENLAKSKDITNFVALDKEVKAKLIKKGFTPKSWSQLSQEAKENEIKCVK